MKSVTMWRILSRLRSLWNRRRVESDMNEELQFHVQSRAEDLIGRGVPEQDAWRKARIEFGGLEFHKEACRDSLGFRLWDELRSDVRSGFRVLRQSPVFTAVAVISLALGIGANTAIFTLANQLLLKSMPVPDSQRLRLFTWAQGKAGHLGRAWGSFDQNDRGESIGTPFPYPLYLEMRRTNMVLDDIVAFKDLSRLTATISGEPEAVDGMLVSGNFYRSLGVPVQAGRPLTADDDKPAASGAAVISDAFWVRRFGRSINALGMTIDINRVPVTIVGVNAPAFNGVKAGENSDVYLPVSMQPQVIPDPTGPLLTQNAFWWVILTGRLKPDISDEGASKALNLAFQRAIHTTMPERKEADIPRLVLKAGNRGQSMELERMKRPIYLLLSVAGLVLLIACANLANLLLARATVRQREISLKLAMGASRMRIMRQILTESLLLATLGGSAGLILGYAGRNFIPNLFEDSWAASWIDAEMDWRVFLFAFAITLLTGLLFGLVPAWSSTRAEANAALKETGRMSTSRPRARFCKALVVLQVALSLLLVVGAGLFLRTLTNLRTAPTGLKTEHVVLFDVNPPRSQYATAARIQLFRRISDGLAAIPGVQNTTMSSAPLLANSMDTDCYRPGEQPPDAKKENIWTNYVGADFFTTFGIALSSGRRLTTRDDEHAPRVTVINQRLAKMFFGHRNPIGRTIRPCDGDAKAPPLEVVGVSADAKYSDLREDPPPTAYIPYTQADDLTFMTFATRTAANVATLIPKLREVVKLADKNLPLLEIRTQTEQIDATLKTERVFATLTSGFGILALLLASIGIYGVMAYTVSRRTNEIGIRMALGARTGAVAGMVLGEASLMTLLGILVGLAVAFYATRLVASMLFGLKATDPMTFAAGAGLMVIVATLAAVIPAWRAAKVDPMEALRHE